MVWFEKVRDGEGTRFNYIILQLEIREIEKRLMNGFKSKEGIDWLHDFVCAQEMRKRRKRRGEGDETEREEGREGGREGERAN